MSWTRRGLLEPTRGPRGAHLFSFQDIVLLRTARELLAAEIPARRVREALEALRDQLPIGRPLSAVHVSTLGDRILVQDADVVWEPDSGQLHIDFEVTDGAERARSVARRTLRDGAEEGDPSADDWYNTALDLEAVAVDEAAAAYRQVIELEPDHADAHLNLGRLLHEEGRVAEAEAHYRTAADADPHSGRALYNLGVALEDQGLRPGAVEAYAAALSVDEELAVAHFNLARLCEAGGQKTEALRHLARYKRLVERSGPGA